MQFDNLGYIYNSKAIVGSSQGFAPMFIDYFHNSHQIQKLLYLKYLQVSLIFLPKAED